MLASEDHVKEMAAKSAAFCILQDQNKELKLSISGTAHQMRLLEDEIQVRFVRCGNANVPERAVFAGASK